MSEGVLLRQAAVRVPGADADVDIESAALRVVVAGGPSYVGGIGEVPSREECVQALLVKCMLRRKQGVNPSLSKLSRVAGQE